MKEYITKDRAKQFVCGHCNEVCSEEPCEPSDCDWMTFIDKEPAADVVEVRHGRWIEKTAHVRHSYFECSNCGAHENKHTAIKGRFCWSCGAIMDGDTQWLST